MKKPLLIVLTLAMLLSLCACGKQSADVGGIWERNVDTDKTAYQTTLYISEDGTYVADEKESIIRGTWKVKGDNIILSPAELLAGEKAGVFMPDGTLAGETTITYQLQSDGTLINGTNTYTRVSNEASTSEIVEKAAISGKWDYNTGFTVWHFIFDRDNSCRYWSGNRESNNTTYVLNNGNLVIDGLDWEFQYQILENGTLELCHIQEDGDKWHFTKDTAYAPNAMTTLELTSEMVDEIENKIEDDDFETLVLFYEQMTAGKELDVTFTGMDIKNHKKTSQHTYTAFGTVYAEDNYGKKYYQNIDIVFTAEEDAEEATGYSIKWDVEFVDD